MEKVKLIDFAKNKRTQLVDQIEMLYFEPLFSEVSVESENQILLLESVKLLNFWNIIWHPAYFVLLAHV